MALSSQLLPDGTRGFFYPGNFVFGQSLYLSQIYAAVEAVQGVDSLEVTVFRKFGSLITASSPRLWFRWAPGRLCNWTTTPTLWSTAS